MNLKPQVIERECRKMIEQATKSLITATDAGVIARLQGRIHALQAVLDLPKTLADNGENPDTMIGDAAGAPIY